MLDSIALICKVLFCFLLASSIAISKSDAILIVDFFFTSHFSLCKLLRSFETFFLSMAFWNFTNDVILFIKCYILGGLFQAEQLCPSGLGNLLVVFLWKFLPCHFFLLPFFGIPIKEILGLLNWSSTFLIFCSVHLFIFFCWLIKKTEYNI